MDTAARKLGKRIMELVSDESIDVPRDSIQRDGFNFYLERQLQRYQDGEELFEYVDNLHDYDEDGKLKKLSGSYDPDSDEIKINSKYEGDDAKTFLYLAHEIYHRLHPEEENEDYVEPMVGEALKFLGSKEYSLAAEAHDAWIERWNEIRRKSVKKDGLYDWNMRMQEVGRRYAEDTGKDPSGWPEWVSGALKGTIDFVEEPIRKYIGGAEKAWLGYEIIGRNPSGISDMIGSGSKIFFRKAEKTFQDLGKKKAAEKKEKKAA